MRVCPPKITGGGGSVRMIGKIVGFITRIENHIVSILLALLSVVVVIQIVSRALKISLAWTTEASIVLFIFIGFLGAVIADREHEHVRVSLIDNYLSTRALIVMRKLLRTAIVLFGLFISFQAYRLGLKQAVSVTPALGLPASIYSLPVVIAGLLISLHGLADLVTGKV